jgi:hypothetical protein
VRDRVEDHQRIGDHEQDVRRVQPGLLPVRQILEKADHVIAHETHTAAVEPRERRVRHRPVPGKDIADRLQGIMLEGARLLLPVPDDFDGPAEAPDHDLGPAAEKGVPRPFLSAFDGLEQKGILAVVDLQERRDRGLHIGEDLPVHGDEVPLFCLLFEFFERRTKHKTPCK